MFKNYLKVVLRNIQKYKGYSFINIVGLAMGLTCCLLLILFIQYELSFDRYHKNADEIYRIVMQRSEEIYMGIDWYNSVPGALKATVPEEFDEVLMATRATRRDRTIKQNDNLFIESDFRYVDQEFLDIFSFPLIAGNPKTALSEPFSLVLTEEMAKKYFGNINPMDKVLNINDRDYKITGVLKNIPKNSHFTFNFIAPFKTLYAFKSASQLSPYEGWRTTSPWCMYILTKKKVDIKELEKKVSGLLGKYRKVNKRNKLGLQPLTSIHLHSKVNLDEQNISDIRYIYLLSMIAFLIIVIACMNYMNLSTARSVKRAKEVGVRKVVGAHRKNLIVQFFGESTLFVLFALIVSIILTYMLIPGFSNFTDRDLNLTLLSSGWMIPGIFGIILFVGLISGSYPALLLSSFKPVHILRGIFISKSGGSSKLRIILVVFQFTTTVVLIICALTTSKQMEYIRTSDLGFQKEHIIYSRAPQALRQNFQPFKDQLEKNPDIKEVYGLGITPINVDNTAFPDWEGKQEEEQLYFSLSTVGYNFIDFFEIELIEGRNFSRDFSTDVSKAWIINETAVKVIGWKNPIGKKFGWPWLIPDGRIIGVVKDFHFNSLHHKVLPMAVCLGNPERPGYYYALKINSEKIPRTLKFIKAKYKEFSLDYPFIYSFLDEAVNEKYQSEQKLNEIFNIFTIIAIFICCIGLLGLVSFTAEQKTKEIGIRKVFGASISKIVIMISREFIKWVVLAALIAFPIAWYAMNKWLENFAYKTDIGIGVYISALLIAFFISIISLGYKSVKAATANPVDSLRYE